MLTDSDPIILFQTGLCLSLAVLWAVYCYWGVVPTPERWVAAVKSRFGCSSPAANQEKVSLLCMLGEGIYGADAISGGSSSECGTHL